MHKPRLLAAILLLALAYFTARAAYDGLAGFDLKTIYYSAQALRLRISPYDDSALKQLLTADGGNTSEIFQSVGMPVYPMLYPPLFPALFSSFTMVSWATAKWLFFLSSLALFGLGLFCLGRRALSGKAPLQAETSLAISPYMQGSGGDALPSGKLTGRAFLIGLALTLFSPVTWSALNAGQAVPLITGGVLLAFCGLPKIALARFTMLALLSLKPTLCFLIIPALILIQGGNRSSFIMAAGAIVAAHMIPVALLPLSMENTFRQVLPVAEQAFHGGVNTYWDIRASLSMINLRPLLHRICCQPESLQVDVCFWAVILPLAWLTWKNRHAGAACLLNAACLQALSVYMRDYDLLLIFGCILIALAQLKPGDKRAWPLIAALILFSIPQECRYTFIAGYSQWLYNATIASLDCWLLIGLIIYSHGWLGKENQAS